MGLFDGYQFDPSTYSGGGLLGMLNFPQPVPSAGFAPVQAAAPPPTPVPAPTAPQTVDMSARGNGNPISSILGSIGGLLAPSQANAQEGPGVGDRLMAGFQGFANSQSPMQALGNLVGGLASGQRSDPQGMALAQMQATYQALRAKGVPDADARAAALNPEVLKTVAGNYFDTKPKFGVIGQNQMGVNQYGFIRENQGTVTPANPGGGPVGNAGGIDPNLTGDALLSAISANPQLGPGKAQMVKAIAEGRQPYPSGFLLKTPFGQWLTTMVGQYEPGLDATLVNRRHTFNQQLGSATPSSVGGQKSLMGTSLGHLSEVADAATALGNSSGPLSASIPGSSYLAHGINSVENTSTNQAAKVKALEDAVQKFSGEVGKLYSGNSGGGIAEREETRSRFSGNLTPQEMAASLEMSKALIQSKLAALQNQQDEIFGQKSKGRIDFLGDSGRAALAKIDAAIAKLRGGTQAAAPSALPSGWTVQVH